MKHSIILFFGLLAFGLAACSDNDMSGEIPSETLSATVSTVTTDYQPSTPVTYTFSASTDWNVSYSDKEDMSITPTSGKAGNQSLTIKMLTANQTSKERSFSFTITTTNNRKTVTVNQPPVFILEKTAITVSPKGEEVTLHFNTPIALEDLSYWCDQVFMEMVGDEETEEETEQSRSVINLPLTRATYNRRTFTIPILPNETGKVREGYLFFAHKDVTLEDLYDPASLISETVTITQASVDSKESVDFSADGEVITLQTHTKGDQGVPIVLMGEAFIDQDIADGTYEEVMRDAVERMFGIEPMTSLRPYFDVYMVNAVSASGQVSDNAQTVFSTQFYPGTTEISGDDEKCVEYALKAIDEKRKNDALILVIINDTRYAGTCSLTATSDTKNEVPSGVSIAYIPMAEGYYNRVIRHEAVGHGLGKLADEYGADGGYAANGSILKDTTTDANGYTPLDILKRFQQVYALLNVSLESDVLKTPWSTFYRDERYASEKLGAYEGADCYPKDIYRPTDNSLMNSGELLNVVGRNLIYKRVMNIAYRYDWKYDYEDFILFDEPSRTSTKSESEPFLFMPWVRHAAPRLILEP